MKIDFPDDPARRRAIVVLDQHAIERCAYDSEYAAARLDEETHFLQFPVPPKQGVHSALQGLADSALLRPGSVLVQSPFDPDSYAEASSAEADFALAKHMHFSKLCMHLGAKSVSVVQVDEEASSDKSSTMVGAKKGVASASLGTDSEELRKLKARMSLTDEFEGGDADIDGAVTHLRRCGLWGDASMRALIEMRSGGAANGLKSRKLNLSLSSEAKSNLKVAARLKLPVASLSADHRRALSHQQDYSLTVLVKF